MKAATSTGSWRTRSSALTSPGLRAESTVRPKSARERGATVAVRHPSCVVDEHDAVGRLHAHGPESVEGHERALADPLAQEAFVEHGQAGQAHVDRRVAAIPRCHRQRVAHPQAKGLRRDGAERDLVGTVRDPSLEEDRIDPPPELLDADHLGLSGAAGMFEKGPAAIVDGRGGADDGVGGDVAALLLEAHVVVRVADGRIPRPAIAPVAQ